MKRRAFLKAVGGAAGVAALGVPKLFGADEPLERVAGIPRRLLGRTGERLSIVGFPGLALTNLEQDECTRTIRSAFERGINYYDVAPAYGNKVCQTKMGIAFQGIDRDKYFLSCKTKKRDAEGCREELEESLKALKTDRFDLFQLHHLVTPAEVKQALGSGGAMETILKAKEQGKLKYIGFSAHTTKSALEAMKGFKFDTVMFPINFVEYYNRGFGKEVLGMANEQGASVLAIKPNSWGAWPKEAKRTRQWWYQCVEDPKDLEVVMRFVLSQKPVVSAIPASFLDVLDQVMDAVKEYKPLDEAATARLKELAADRGSIFQREEDRVALNLPHREMPYPHHPHECA